MIAPAAMALAERWLLRTWILVTGAALAGMMLGVFWWWIVFVLTIPLVFAAWYAPTAWLYLTAALLPWLALRRRSHAIAGIVSLVAVAGVGFGLPWLMNRAIMNEAADWVAGDRPGFATIMPGRTVALLDDLSGEYCSRDCVALLLDRGAAAVLLGDGGALQLDPQRSLARLRLVARGARPCTAARWPADSYNPTGRVEDLDRRLGEVFGSERCLVIDRAPTSLADMVFVHRIERQGPRGADSQGRWPRLFDRRQRAEALVRQGPGQALLARRSSACVRRLSTPLTVWPMSGADTSTPAHWGKTGECPDLVFDNMLFRQTPASGG